MPSTIVIPDVSARKLYEYRIAGKTPEELGGNYGRAIRVLEELGVPRREDMSYPEFVDAVRNALPENVRSAFEIGYSVVSKIGKVTPDSLYSVARRLKRVGIRKVTLAFLLGLLKGVKIPGPARIPTGEFDHDPVAVTLSELGGVAKISNIVKRLENKGFENARELVIESFLKGKFYPIPENKRSPTLPPARKLALETALKKGSVEERGEDFVVFRLEKSALTEDEIKALSMLPEADDRDAYFALRVALGDNIRVISTRLL